MCPASGCLGGLCARRGRHDRFVVADLSTRTVEVDVAGIWDGNEGERWVVWAK